MMAGGGDLGKRRGGATGAGLKPHRGTEIFAAVALAKEMTFFSCYTLRVVMRKALTMRATKTLRALTVALVTTLPVAGFAQTILSVTTPEKEAAFTKEELLEMPQLTVVTKNDYVDDVTTFQGPSLRHVLEEMEIGPEAQLKMVALNDFVSQVPAQDAFDYDVVLAVLRDGEEMPVRGKGPIWLIYPMDAHPELKTEVYNNRLVWQLKSILVE